jgi:hypothetical protein
MNDFITKYQNELTGTLSGFDRLVFRGTLWRNRVSGMKGYLWAHHLASKDFGEHAEQISKRVKEAATQPMLAAGRPVRYLNSGKDDKQKIALEIAAADRVREGPICALTAVELCNSYAIRRDEQTGKPDLKSQYRKGLTVYQYWMDPTFGFMSIRLQTWFPFSIHIYLNGREWLSRQMDQARIAYRRHDNCFTWIEDLPRAQELMNDQRKVNWVQSFDQLARRIHPLLFTELNVNYPMKYYWTSVDSEWAMDLMFRDRERLRRLVPRLMHLGIVSLSSADVLRFMGKKVSRTGTALGGSELPISSDLKVRSNGARVKHRLGPNSLKLYDKAYDELGAVLRSEITISVPKYFKVFRRTDDPESLFAYRPLRQSTADVHLRADLSQKVLDRYCSALAVVDDTTTLEELTSSMERRVRWNHKSVRALHPFDRDDHILLQAVNRGEFNIAGFRNRDLQPLLHPTEAKTDKERRRRSAAISRKLRMLRAHGLIRKRPRSPRYDVSANGRLILNAILSAHTLTVRQITTAGALIAA